MPASDSRTPCLERYHSQTAAHRGARAPGRHGALGDGPAHYCRAAPERLRIYQPPTDSKPLNVPWSFFNFKVSLWRQPQAVVALLQQDLCRSLIPGPALRPVEDHPLCPLPLAIDLRSTQSVSLYRSEWRKEDLDSMKSLSSCSQCFASFKAKPTQQTMHKLGSLQNPQTS